MMPDRSARMSLAHSSGLAAKAGRYPHREVPQASTHTLQGEIVSGGSDVPMLVDRLEAARMLGVSPGTIDNLRNAGELPSLKLMSRRLYDVADLRRFVDGRKERA